LVAIIGVATTIGSGSVFLYTFADLNSATSSLWLKLMNRELTIFA
jgi:hypothetical protein